MRRSFSKRVERASVSMFSTTASRRSSSRSLRLRKIALRKKAQTLQATCWTCGCGSRSRPSGGVICESCAYCSRGSDLLTSDSTHRRHTTDKTTGQRQKPMVPTNVREEAIHWLCSRSNARAACIHACTPSILGNSLHMRYHSAPPSSPG